MNNIEFVDKLREELKKRPGFGENDSHFITFCPSCETNRDPSSHGHFYINKVKPNLPYSCKKCTLSSSTMSTKLLQKIDIHDTEIISFAHSNFKVIHSHIINVDERNKKVDYEVPLEVSKSDKFKLLSLSDRLLYNINNENDIKKFRIVSNLSKFLKSNNIEVSSLTEKEQTMIPLLDRYYLGFLSYFGNIINFRNMSDLDKYPRYINIKINKDIKRSFLYTPMTSLDILTLEPKISASEGVIDIISINLENSQYDLNNNIYIATGSSGAFRSSIKTALSLTGYYGATINLYLDNDDLVDKIDKFNTDKIVKALNGFGKDFKVNVIINTSNKDFGNRREDVTIGKINITNLLT